MKRGQVRIKGDKETGRMKDEKDWPRQPLQPHGQQGTCTSEGGIHREYPSTQVFEVALPCVGQLGWQDIPKTSTRWWEQEGNREKWIHTSNSSRCRILLRLVYTAYSQRNLRTKLSLANIGQRDWETHPPGTTRPYLSVMSVSLNILRSISADGRGGWRPAQPQPSWHRQHCQSWNATDHPHSFEREMSWSQPKIVVEWLKGTTTPAKPQLPQGNQLIPPPLWSVHPQQTEMLGQWAETQILSIVPLFCPFCLENGLISEKQLTAVVVAKIVNEGKQGDAKLREKGSSGNIPSDGHTFRQRIPECIVVFHLCRSFLHQPIISLSISHLLTTTVSLSLSLSLSIAWSTISSLFRSRVSSSWYLSWCNKDMKAAWLWCLKTLTGTPHTSTAPGRTNYPPFILVPVFLLRWVLFNHEVDGHWHEAVGHFSDLKTKSLAVSVSHLPFPFPSNSSLAPPSFDFLDPQFLSSLLFSLILRWQPTFSPLNAALILNNPSIHSSLRLPLPSRLSSWSWELLHPQSHLSLLLLHPLSHVNKHPFTSWSCLVLFSYTSVTHVIVDHIHANQMEGYLDSSLVIFSKLDDWG